MPARGWVLTGLVLGSLTFVGHEWLPEPWRLLGDSFGLWCLVPFLAGRASTSLRRALLAGVVGGWALDVGYYATSAVLVGRTERPSVLGYWLAAAVVVGLTMGTAGRLSRRPGRLPAACAALPASVLVLEVLPVVGFHVFNGVAEHALQAVWVALAIALTAVLAGGRERRVMALVVLPVLAALAWGGWLVARAVLSSATS